MAVVVAVSMGGSLLTNVQDSADRYDRTIVRAVAMTRRRLRRMILSQAPGVAVVSLVPGLAASGLCYDDPGRTKGDVRCGSCWEWTSAARRSLSAACSLMALFTVP
ncbi:MAG: hypothetical protein ACYCX3_11930 [Thermoleophilia bacterium]